MEISEKLAAAINRRFCDWIATDDWRIAITMPMAAAMREAFKAGAVMAINQIMVTILEHHNEGVR